ncbi:MAG: ribonucleoside-diphosphate reductase subunit alpha [Spirochaetales bacterium]|nr:ribonucleoside-diphosphate reductase subunit alpha [Spirochaetales bacterium]
MYIIKRDGHRQPYESAKIYSAIERACSSTGTATENELIDKIVSEIEVILHKDSEKQQISVEHIQDIVERHMMENGLYEQAKNFILYREKHTKKRNDRNSLLSLIPGLDEEECDRLAILFINIEKDFTNDVYALSHLLGKFTAFVKDGMNKAEALRLLVKAAVELTVQEAPDWEFIASRIEYFCFSEELSLKIDKLGIITFYDKIVWLTNNGLYGCYILEAYSQDDIDFFEKNIDMSRNNLLNFSGLDLLLKRYVIKDKTGNCLETPQEMFMGIAMHLCMNESTDRQAQVVRLYDLLSRLQITMATPTLSNARKPFHQLSSCFIDTVPDSLEGIYRSISSFAQVSKYGGGMGLYFGKVRAAGSPIRGFKGAAGGLNRWIKLANDTAVSVDQLGVRQGAVAVYLDIWHKDLPEFLQLRTNNGDDRMKAHDVFPALCVPDLFWRTVKEGLDGEWSMVCPHDVLTVKGYSLEDFWGTEWEERYLDCLDDERITKRTIGLKDLVRMIIKSGVETGTPFIFNRDLVNRMNPNSHRGVIYCSNLCTEIAQNTSASSLQSKTIQTADGETIIVEKTIPGDFVECNLASLVLGNIDTHTEGELEAVVKTTVRALDNVIDLNFYPVPYAEITNKEYRSLGLGISGYHHFLAKEGIRWESEEHLSAADRILERINFAAIEASAELASEKAPYKYFDGSDWATGAYFEKRDYSGSKWNGLKQKVKTYGMRNAYLLAVAPTSSTSIIAGTTAGTDPVMKKFFLEEKKGMTIARVAPGLNSKTYWLYKNAHHINQSWLLRAAGIRQRHIDQSQSINLYITTDFSLRQVLNLYIMAWEEKVKTLYYIRSTSLEVEECESCAS